MFESIVQYIPRPTTRRRSLLLKTVGYRILSVLVTTAIAFVLLRDAAVAVDIGIWANLAKMGVYYAYEQAWAGAQFHPTG